MAYCVVARLWRWRRCAVDKSTLPGMRQTDRQTSHMTRCVTFAVEIGEILHIFPSGTESMGDRGSKMAYTGPRTAGIYLPTKIGCDQSIVVGCRSRND